MADEKTGPDAIRSYLTGAASDGAAQTDPDASLGKFRSASLADFIGVSAASLQTGIAVDFVSGNCETGSASIIATDTTSLAFTAPGGSQGPAVTIANGETKILLDGTTSSKFVRVTRSTADNLTGTATLTLTDVLNNVIGFDNVDSTEAAAGDTEYRCISVKNESAVDAVDLKFFLGTLGTQRTTDTAQLAASGADTIETSGSFADWPDQGFARVVQSGGTLREIVYYASRTDTMLTVPAAGRGLLGTSAGAGASDDTVDAISALRLAVEKVIRDPFLTTGTGLDDITTGGRLTDATATAAYQVKITTAAATDQFQWSDDGGSTFNGSDIDITGSAQTLQTGITVTFAATTGHTADDVWSFKAGFEATDKTSSGEGSEPGASGGADGAAFVWGSGIASADSLFDALLANGYQVYLWLRREIPAGAINDPSVLQLIEMNFDA